MAFTATLGRGRDGKPYGKRAGNRVRDEVADGWGSNTMNSLKALPCPALQRGCVPASPVLDPLDAARPLFRGF